MQALDLPRFNVTHSDDLALIAVSLDRELESISSENERSWRRIGSSSRISQPPRRASTWGSSRRPGPPRSSGAGLRKEAILKARGVGLAGLASGFETMFGTTPLVPRFTLASPFPTVQGWRLWEAAPRDFYVAAVAVEDSRPGPEPLLG